MPGYQQLSKRFDAGDVVILNGDIGTELERLGVKLQDGLQRAMATETHPDIVRKAHENYIEAGARIITANTSVAGKGYLEAGGLGHKSDALNRMSVGLALEAREVAAVDPVWIAGAISTYGICELKDSGRVRTEFARQAEVLTEAGADLLLLEVLGCDAPTAVAAIEEASSTGVPVWVALSEMPDSSGNGVSETAAELAQVGGEVCFVFHTPVEIVPEALRQLRDSVHVPVGVYPHCGGPAGSGRQPPNTISPAGFLEAAKAWVGDGAQIVGGCCGIGLDHVKALGEGLPRSTR